MDAHRKPTGRGANNPAVARHRQESSRMALTPSQRPTREWLLLVVAFGLIAALCVPLWQWSGQSEAQAGFFEKFRSPERLGRLLLGPEQIACYICAAWAGFIVWSRYAEVLRQRRAFHQEIL